MRDFNQDAPCLLLTNLRDNGQKQQVDLKHTFFFIKRKIHDTIRVIVLTCDDKWGQANTNWYPFLAPNNEDLQSLKGY